VWLVGCSVGVNEQMRSVSRVHRRHNAREAVSQVSSSQWPKRPAVPQTAGSLRHIAAVCLGRLLFTWKPVLFWNHPCNSCQAWKKGIQTVPQPKARLYSGQCQIGGNGPECKRNRMQSKAELFYL